MPPQGYKFIPGDRYLLNLLRKLAGLKKVSGVERVFVNLCKSLDELKVKYTVNKPFKLLQPDEPVVVLGSGKYSLQGYQQPNKIIAGIALMTHPNEWPTLFTEYPVALYLQHSDWTNNLYAKHFGQERCAIWPAGIDTKAWQPNTTVKQFDVLIYKKIMWNRAEAENAFYQPIVDQLNALGFSYREVVYGHYNATEYKQLLQDCRAMIFLCEHESQGFACGEAMAMNVPVLAWDQGFWLDPKRFDWGETEVQASSVPYFDEKCGLKFNNINAFKTQLPLFWEKVKNNSFAPRAFVEQNLSLQKSAERMLEIINTIYV